MSTTNVQEETVIQENRSITTPLAHVANDNIIAGNDNVVINASFRVYARETARGETEIVARLTGSVYEQGGDHTRFEASNEMIVKNLGRIRNLEFMDAAEGHLAWTEVAGENTAPKQFGPGHPGLSNGVVRTFYVPVHGGDLQVALSQVRVRYSRM